MTYQFKTTPWEHQKTAMRLAWRQPGYAFLMEMGSGKSKVCVDEFCLMYEEGLTDTVLVLAPKGVYLNWSRREIPTHAPDRVLAEATIVEWASGGGTKKQSEALQKHLKPRPGLRILVMNTEALSSGTLARDYATKYLASSKMAYAVVDESTLIKNHSSARTKAVIKLGKGAMWRRIMTGSPVTKGPMDLYSQFEFLQPGLLGQSFYAYRARYAVLRDQYFGGRRVATIVGYRNMDLLAKEIEPWSYRVTKEECMDLPAKIYTRRDVELTPEQHRMYVEMKEFAMAALDPEQGAMMSAQLAIVQMLRLHQLVCGHVTDDDGEVHDVPNNRLQALMDAVDEAAGKVIIWSRWRRDLDKIVNALRTEYGSNAVAEYHGGNTDKREADAQRFINDPHCRFMVSTQQSGGRGNTWIVATTVIYYSNDYDLEKRIQSEDRAHRGGQTEHVTYVDLVSPGTVDEKIIDALRAKINIAAMLTGDQVKEWIV